MTLRKTIAKCWPLLTAERSSVYFFVWMKLLAAQQIETFFSTHIESSILIQTIVLTLISRDPQASIATSSCFPQHSLSLYLCFSPLNHCTVYPFAPTYHIAYTCLSTHIYFDVSIGASSFQCSGARSRYRKSSLLSILLLVTPCC